MKCQIHADTEVDLDIETGFHRDYKCPKCQKIIAKALEAEKKRLAKTTSKK